MSNGSLPLKPLIYSQADLSWLEWSRYLTRKIATIYGVSPQELGIPTQEKNEPSLRADRRQKHHGKGPRDDE